jgi:hypothetical protein
MRIPSRDMVPSLGLEPVKGIPTPFPHMGRRGDVHYVLVLLAFCRGLATWLHPRLRSVLWLARQQRGLILAKEKPASAPTGYTGELIRDSVQHRSGRFNRLGLTWRLPDGNALRLDG